MSDEKLSPDGSPYQYSAHPPELRPKEDAPSPPATAPPVEPTPPEPAKQEEERAMQAEAPRRYRTRGMKAKADETDDEKDE